MSLEHLEETVKKEVVEETFGGFQETVVDYKEEVDRPAGVLTFWEPERNTR